MSELPIRSDLVGLTPYGAPQLDVPVRLNVNENPFAPSEQLVKAIADAVTNAATSLNRYPDRDAVKLREDLAAFITQESNVAVDTSNIWPANGSNEVMMHLLQLFGGPGKRLVTFSPTYSMYPDYCRDTFTEFVTVARRDDFSIDAELIDEALALSPDILVFTSPNNPTGTVLDRHVLDYVIDKFNGIVIVDEAYAEFRPSGQSSAVDYVKVNPRVIVTRTMSKAFSCAGLRLGYAVAHPSVVDACQIVRLPYHLSAVTQAVARAALANWPELLGHVELLRNERDELANWLADQGFQVAASGANFLMFGTFADRHHVWQQILDHGVLIRETGPSGWLRVSIGTPAENALFREALLASDID